MFVDRCRTCGRSNERYVGVAKGFICRSCATMIAWLVEEQQDQVQMVELSPHPTRIAVADRALRTVPRAVALDANVLPLDVDQTHLTVMAPGKPDFALLEKVESAKGLKIELVKAPIDGADFSRAIRSAYARLERLQGAAKVSPDSDIAST